MSADTKPTQPHEAAAAHDDSTNTNERPATHEGGIRLPARLPAVFGAPNVNPTTTRASEVDE